LLCLLLDFYFLILVFFVQLLPTAQLFLFFIIYRLIIIKFVIVFKRVFGVLKEIQKCK
jgi:hypothetical protein